MHSLMISVCTLVAVPGQSGVSTSAVAQQLPVSRSSIELRTAVRDTMRREAMAATFADRSKAIRELCEIFVEIATGDAMNDTLRDRYLGKVRSRLRRTQRDLEIQVSRDQRSKSRSAPQADLPATVSLATSLATGSAATLSRGGAAAENGQALVELIQATIAPEVWDVNGGQATIFYFAPVHALVVRAPGEVHRQAAGLLDNVRRVGN